MAEAPVEFFRLIQEIRSRDPLVYESAYHELSAAAPRFVSELLDQLKTSVDPYTRGKFVELLGDSGDPRAIPALAAELRHPDQDLRQWAVSSLERIGGAAALELVNSYRKEHPSEFA